MTTPQHGDRSGVPAWCRRLLALAAALVPDAVRAEWRREWETELWYHERRLRADGSRARGVAVLGWRLGGAVVHAAWMRQRLWRRDMIGQDLRHAIRMMGARPALTATVLATVALGVGANTAVFSVVHAALVRPLPFEDPDRLVVAWPGLMYLAGSPFTLPYGANAGLIRIHDGFTAAILAVMLLHFPVKERK